MNGSSLVMSIIMLAIFMVFVGIASGYPADARFMPFVVGIPAIALCLLQIVLDVRQRRQVAEPAADAGDARSQFEAAEERISRMAGRKVEFEVAHQDLPVEGEPHLSPRETVRRELALWGWFLAFVAGVLLFGFWVSIPIFLIAFLRFQAEASWRTALILGIPATIILFLAFEKAFRIELHPGFLTQYVTDWLRT